MMPSVVTASFHTRDEIFVQIQDASLVDSVVPLKLLNTEVDEETSDF